MLVFLCLFILRFSLILRFFRVYLDCCVYFLVLIYILCFLNLLSYSTLHHTPSTCRPSPQAGSLVRPKAQTHRLVEEERGGNPTTPTPTSRRNWDHCTRRCGDRLTPTSSYLVKSPLVSSSTLNCMYWTL